jgi:hypothetical protein
MVLLQAWSFMEPRTTLISWTRTIPEIHGWNGFDYPLWTHWVYPAVEIAVFFIVRIIRSCTQVMLRRWLSSTRFFAAVQLLFQTSRNYVYIVGICCHILKND